MTNPINSTSYSDNASIIQSSGNLYQSTMGTPTSATDIGGAAFKPPYTYTADATSGLESAVRAGAGPK